MEVQGKLGSHHLEKLTLCYTIPALCLNQFLCLCLAENIHFSGRCNGENAVSSPPRYKMANELSERLIVLGEDGFTCLLGPLPGP